ncbi:hypothetical protein B0T16DRAFT_393098 [Cercophora newfieldiana]|uniref:Uncharacterized protein n=1 Tax=Cercophora newfieldiana TaxID=92897 RepID=A0AA39XWI9_9PEZI|nr:hypothetical protein B0T16DRAFT_393098 [Cercophora newfieldiana]
MVAMKTSAARTALRALRPQSQSIRLQQFAPTQVRYATSGGPGEPSTTGPTNPRQQAPGVGEKGTSKEFNKDGTNSNKNVVYAGLAALTVGAMLYVSMTPKKEMEKSSPPTAR